MSLYSDIVALSYLKIKKKKMFLYKVLSLFGLFVYQQYAKVVRYRRLRLKFPDKKLSVRLYRYIHAR